MPNKTTAMITIIIRFVVSPNVLVPIKAHLTPSMPYVSGSILVTYSMIEGNPCSGKSAPDRKKMGILAARRMLDIINGKHPKLNEVVLKPALVERESVADIKVK